MKTFLGIPVPEKWVPFIWGKECPLCHKFMAYAYDPKRYTCSMCYHEERR